MKHCILVLTAGMVIAATTAGSPPLLKAPWRAFETGEFPNLVPTFGDHGDLDGDGDRDYVVGLRQQSGAGLSVLINQGDATFAAPLFYDEPQPITEVMDLRLHDIDLDGDLDVVNALSGPFLGKGNQVEVWRNDGSGVFETPMTYEVGLMPEGIAIADFTGDGFDDVVAANTAHDSISLLVHNGLSGDAFGFLDAVETAVGDNAARPVAGDLDGDGDIDLAVGRAGFTGGSGVTILENDGAGTFSILVDMAAVPGASTSSAAVDLVDVNGDGSPDLLSAGSGSGGSMVAIRLNDGLGSFGTAVVYTASVGGGIPFDIEAKDLTGDGAPEIVYSTPSSAVTDGFHLLLNDGSGGFGATTFFNASPGTRDVDLFDVDADGDRDVVTVSATANVVTVHPNLGDATFFTMPTHPLGGLTKASDAADVDGDGDLDVVTFDFEARLMRNLGDGAFSGVVTVGLPSPGSISGRLLDITGDGASEILALYATVLWVGLNDGAGNFSVTTSIATDACSDYMLETIDLDGDGDRDVVIPDNFACEGDLRLHLFRNDGDGTLHPVAPAVLPDNATDGLITADMNGDGLEDVIVDLGGDVGVMLSNGDLTLQPPIMHRGLFPDAMDTADVNGDGHRDLLVLLPQPSFGTNSVGLLLGNGDGSLQRRQEYTAVSFSSGPIQISSDVDGGDLNLDGFGDLLLTSNAPGDIAVFLGTPEGTLLPPDRYGIGASADHTLLRDFTGDGALDVGAVIAAPPFGMAAFTMGRGLAEPGVTGDIDGDGVVGFSDLLWVLSTWGPCPSPPAECPADVDGDGSVGFPDLLIVLAAWG